MEYFDVQWFHAYSKYPAGYSINTYAVPNGNFTGRVDGTVSYDIYYRKGGLIAIDSKKYVEEKYFDIK
ncbi:peptidase M23 [Bacillus albus]|uniref:peptidase M23 n=1 Tax=Bacillus albus TaxID=2026189 RepID=UPI001009E3AD|nr:peptidase M23 [Bacillus albus]RXJ19840.1 peptidase M23 [Bacillus albus]RXJ30083.1 peptidase M23 [Bacillus albus]RXJ31675.1 peptidase M23 [Bacillus albus]RXJ42899.1 peptidase M23 [Bacillus albus]RXJ59827.1 peptidase M23 [Bacillus albus]